jgi:hypothetical protein
VPPPIAIPAFKAVRQTMRRLVGELFGAQMPLEIDG